jgi:phospholipid/cholesterol/gamma-HCH transport system ATP-binding protein
MNTVEPQGMGPEEAKSISRTDQAASAPLTTHHSPLTTHHSPVTTHHSPVTTHPLISLTAVSIHFNGQRVLENIRLDVQRGQTLVVVGESGCGKTVLLKLITGLLRPTRGRVLFDGRDLAGLNDRELTQLRLGMGFLFQGAALFDSLSVYDNVAFGPRNVGQLSEAEIRERVRQRLQEVGLPAAVEEKKPAELSGGMKKRVGLARALALDPEVMLYDEPTTGLDPIMSDVINELILQTRRQRPVTSIIVTHDMRTVLKVADRIVMLYPLAHLTPGQPQILFDGAPEQLQQCEDERVRQFVAGEAGQRLRELTSNIVSV